MIWKEKQRATTAFYLRSRIHKIGTALLLSCVTLVFAGCAGSGSNVSSGAVTTNASVDGLVISTPVTAVDSKDATKSYVIVSMMTQGKVAEIRTESIATADVSKLSANLVKGALVGYQKHATLADYAKIPTDASKTFVNVITTNASGTNYTMDAMKYGPELPAIDKVSGNLVAAGWIFAKDTTAKTITVGDGHVVTKDMAGHPYAKPLKRFDETYKLSDNVVVYNVNTADYTKSAVSTLAALPVTADYNYSTTSRQQVYCVFDKNFKGADSAKVSAIYYFTPKSTTDGKPVWDVPTQSSLLLNMGTVPPYESATYAGQRYYDIVTDPNITYSASSEPFEIIKSTLYWVGDNEVSMYLVKTKDRLILIDTGWPNNGCIYWKNIEAMGYDPRQITDIMLTHAHGDHYGTTVELINMIENAGNTVKVWASKEDVLGWSSATPDAEGNIWNIAATLPAKEALLKSKITDYFVSEKTNDFGNVQITPVLTPGHTSAVYSMFINVLNPTTQKWINFAFHGGYGYGPLKSTTAASGWKRLALQSNLAHLQQMETSGYILPQHTDMYPLVEVFQAVKAWNNDPANANNQKTVLDGLTTTSDRNQAVNMFEKRYQTLTNPLADTDPNFPCWSIQEYGPFKQGRENGLTGVSVVLQDGGKIIRGYNMNQNINSNFPLLVNGVNSTDKELFVHDPDGYYVQFTANVIDAYKGYIPDGYTQLIRGNLLTYVGGPVDSIYKGGGSPEAIRTQRLSSLADAQAILTSVAKGGTYKVDLTKASAIIVPADVTKTFTAP